MLRLFWAEDPKVRFLQTINLFLMVFVNGWPVLFFRNQLGIETGSAMGIVRMVGIMIIIGTVWSLATILILTKTDSKIEWLDNLKSLAGVGFIILFQIKETYYNFDIWQIVFLMLALLFTNLAGLLYFVFFLISKPFTCMRS